MQSKLLELCGLPLDQNLKLIYKATRDGFSSKSFHEKCDGRTKTLTIIKTTSGNVFGGFAERAWLQDGEIVTDPEAYIFSFINQDNKPFKVMCTNEGKDAIRCFSNHGPLFGADAERNSRDICISTDSNMNEESFSHFGHSYKHPDYQRGTQEADSILAGSRHFKTVEIEVYHLII